MRFIDSHTHLADPKFTDDVDAVIARAREAGAVALVAIGESLDAAARARALVARYPGYLYHTAGVHPYDAATFDSRRDIPAIRAEVEQGAVAVGECGLDYSYDTSTPVQQRRAFADQLALAAELGRPVIVHTRQAEDDTAAMVREAGAAGIGGVLHCYTGGHALARTALDAGWYISFSGIITFKKWEDEALLRLVPDDRVLAESDAPYLAPVPNRGKRNEPAWVARTVEHLATVRGVSHDVMGELVTANAQRFFGLSTHHQESTP
jgi:TatD DNase family protein